MRIQCTAMGWYSQGMSDAADEARIARRKKSVTDAEATLKEIRRLKQQFTDENGADKIRAALSQDNPIQLKSVALAVLGAL